MTRWGRVSWILALALASGCNPPPAPLDDGGGPTDGGSTQCALDRDCDDGLFCTGHETCSPGHAGADVHGCVAPTAVACAAPLTCNEVTDSCIANCDDADGDHHGAVSCGGDDCDDTNAATFPGAVEVCDQANVDEDCDPTSFGTRDVDGDGVTSAICCNGTHCGTDCNDIRRDANPTAPEVCDAVDNDCDDSVDEGLILAQFLDADHDGIGDESRPLTACPGAPGVSTVGGDCDDTRASVRPTAPEICDTMDNDCDTSVDEDAIAVPWYVDADHDGWGFVSPTAPSIDSCVPPADRAIRPGDCDDTDPAISPSAAELCNGIDDNCNGRADYVISARNTEDDDQDGYADMDCHVASNTDCNDEDRNASVPGSPELCDHFDNDCDGNIDEDTAPGDWYADVDGDGHGDPASSPINSCPIVAGRVRNHDDCDDNDRGTFPGAADSCLTRLGVDDDCDGIIDEGGSHITLYVDADDDGYGTGMPYPSCLQDTHSSTRNGDCDDTNGLVHPGAGDDCTGIPGVDDNCNTLIDETTTTPNYWADSDGDGFGGGTPTATCTPAPGSVPNGNDCDDTNRFRNPTVPDDCATARGVDDDCDGSVDEAVVLRDYFVDSDSDGFGAGGAMPACSAPTGTSSLSGDCDDTNAMRNPGAPDDCSRPMGVDDDCDGTIDEAATFVTLYRDVDGDSYGSGAGVLACGTLLGYVALTGDCNEASVSIHPGRPDDCTTMLGVDDDCDVTVDEDVVLRSWYADADRDGYGVGTPMMACTAPVNYAPNPGDCDDANAAKSPGRLDDCTGVVAVDDDCDMIVDEGAASMTFYRDADADGYGDPTVTRLGCAVTAGYVATNTDCDDTRSAAHPGGTETIAGGTCADAIDNDCDTRVDCADSGCTLAPSCGNTLTILSGNALSAPSHTQLAMPTVVRLTDGTGTPLSGRTVSLTTTSATATGYSGVTDATGQVSFQLRSGLPLVTESFAFHALGVPDVVGTVTATAQTVGNLFSIVNGARNLSLRGFPGPTYDASLSGANQGFMAAGADGNIFFGWSTGSPYDDHIYRIRPDGVVEVFAGNQPYYAGVSISEGASATSINLGYANAIRLAYDQPGGLLYFTAGCGIYSIDIATRTVHRVLGAFDVCNYSGDGARALDATSYTMTGIAVNDIGMVYFVANRGATPGAPVVRVIDTGGAVSFIVQGGTSHAGLSLGTQGPIVVAPLPGSTDVLFNADCAGIGACLVRTDVAGNTSLFAGGGTDRITDGVLAATQMQLDVAYPWDFGIATSPAGEVYVMQYPANDIRRIDTTGHVYTVVGTRYVTGDVGDGGPGTSALLRSVGAGAAWGGTHFVFFDGANRAIRALW